MENKELDKVSYKKLKSMVEAIEKHPQMKDRLDELEISFEYIIGSLFPNVLNNVKQALGDEHTKGYIEGLEESKKKCDLED